MAKDNPRLIDKAAAEIQRSKVDQKQMKRSAAEFVLTELSLGLGFAGRASQYFEEGRVVDAKGNLKAAQEAYKAILKFLPIAKLNPREQGQVETDLARLKLLVEAGVSIS